MVWQIAAAVVTIMGVAGWVLLVRASLQLKVPNGCYLHLFRRRQVRR
jgi:hypothetical protein